jgi:hypothetical protein
MKRDHGLVGFLERWRSSAIGLRPVLSAGLLGVRRLEVERDLREVWRSVGDPGGGGVLGGWFSNGVSFHRYGLECGIHEGIDDKPRIKETGPQTF